MKYLISTLILFTLIACSKNEDPEAMEFLDCTVISENYQTYNDEEIECQFYYTLTEFNEELFIELNSHCVDLSRPTVINNNCEDICAEGPYDENSECGQYLKGRESIRVLLIEK